MSDKGMVNTFFGETAQTFMERCVLGSLYLGKYYVENWWTLEKRLFSDRPIGSGYSLLSCSLSASVILGQF
jgi:hypothetical protein